MLGIKKTTLQVLSFISTIHNGKAMDLSINLSNI